MAVKPFTVGELLALEAIASTSRAAGAPKLADRCREVRESLPPVTEAITEGDPKGPPMTDLKTTPETIALIRAAIDCDDTPVISLDVTDVQDLIADAERLRHMIAERDALRAELVAREARYREVWEALREVTSATPEPSEPSHGSVVSPEPERPSESSLADTAAPESRRCESSSPRGRHVHAAHIPLFQAEEVHRTELPMTAIESPKGERMDADFQRDMATLKLGLELAGPTGLRKSPTALESLTEVIREHRSRQWDDDAYSCGSCGQRSTDPEAHRAEIIRDWLRAHPEEMAELLGAQVETKIRPNPERHIDQLMVRVVGPWLIDRRTTT